MMSRELIENFCSFISKDTSLVQGTGGNISWKSDNKLYVKASGTSLGETLKKNIFVDINLKYFSESTSLNNFKLNLKNFQTSLRPSIETMFHGLIPFKYVLHLHAVEPLSSLVRKEKFERKIWEKCPNNPIIINYKKPGEDLAKEIFMKSIKKKFSNLYLLRNHGIIICANKIEEIEKILNSTIKYFKKCNSNFYKTKPKNTISVNFEIDKFKFHLEKKFYNLFWEKKFYSFLKTNWNLYPDHVVFFNSKPIIFECLKDFYNSKMSDEKLIFIKGIGALINKNLTNHYIDNLNLYFDVLSKQSLNKNLENLRSIEVKKLTNWEAEKYRKKLIS